MPSLLLYNIETNIIQLLASAYSIFLGSAFPYCKFYHIKSITLPEYLIFNRSAPRPHYKAKRVMDQTMAFKTSF